MYRVIKEIFTTVDGHIEGGNLITELQMSALPYLYEQSVKLIEFLVKFRNRSFSISVD